jgi:hypothetical protein
MKSKYQDASRLLLLRDDYGAVSLGFNIDTNGSISDITFINNVHSKLDSDAIKFIRSTDKKWIPAIKNGVKRNSHKEFDIMYYQMKETRVSHWSVYHNPSSRFDYHLAKELFTKKEYKQCLAKLNKVSKFDIHNPEVFYYRGLTYINLGDAEKGCEDIIFAKYLAEQYGYPIIMEKEKIETFLKSSCGVE